MTLDKKIIKNYLYNLSYQILVIIVPLITTPYVSRVLGAVGVGTFSYTNSITQYFILFGAIGLNLYAQREIAYRQGNKKDYSVTFYEIFIIKALCLMISIVLFYIFATGYTKYTVIFYIQIIDIIAAIFDISWFFQGLEDFKKIVIRNFIVKIAGVICIFVFIKTSSDLWLYVLCHSLTILLGNLSMWIYVPSLVNKINLKSICLKKHIRPAIMLFIPQIATSLYTLLDKTMIGVLTGFESEVAYYEQSQKIVKIALTVATSLGTVMMPRIANVFANNEKEKIEYYMSQAFHFIFILSLPITLGLMAISPKFVPWFFGEGYNKVILNMIIISPIIFIIGLSNVIGTLYLLPTNRQKEYTSSVIIGSVTNIILNILLIPHFLSYGAAMATVCAETFVTLTQIYFVRNDFNLKLIFKSNFKYLILSLTMFSIVFSTGLLFEATISTTIIQIVLGILCYLILLLLTKDDLIISIVNKLK